MIIKDTMKQNIDDALMFFQAFAKGDNYADIRLIDDNKLMPAKLLSNLEMSDASSKELIEHQKQGYGIFLTINKSDGKGVKNNNINQVRALFVDFDDNTQDNLAVINNMKLQPNMVIETSPKKYHAYWFVDDCPLTAFNQAQQALSKRFNSDPSVCDLARIMRVPGFYHQKGQPFLTRIISTCAEKYSYVDVVNKLALELTATNQTPDKFRSAVGNDINAIDADFDRREIAAELSSTIGANTLDDLYAPDGPMPFLLKLDYGKEHNEWIKLAANHQPYIGTPHEDRAKALLDNYLQNVGGNYNPDENDTRLQTFNQGHPNAIFAIAQQLGWLNPKKIYSAGYQITQEGIYKLSSPDKNGEFKKVRICSWMIVQARTRGLNGYNHGYLIKWRDKDNHIKQQAIPASALHDPSSLIESLTNAGLAIVPSRSREVLTYIEAFKVETVVDCTTETGWYNDDSFVLPSQSYRPNNNKTSLLFQGTNTVKNITNVKGDLNEWQKNIGKLCVGNSRLTLSVCVALAAPMLKMLNLENGGFHLVGDSSLGKSTALKVACSVFGSPAYAKSWKATSTGLEYIAATYNDLPLALDELKQASPETISDAIYMLANGKGKERGKKEGGLRPLNEFRTLVLSTGERTPAELLKEKGGIHAGQEVRLINIPADTKKYGLFETTHQSYNGEHFSNLLMQNSALYYGSAGDVWIKHLVNSQEAIIEASNQLMSSFSRNLDTNNYDGQLKRVLSRFALLAAAGELATAKGITGWNKNDATEAMHAVFQSYLSSRGGIGKNEDQDIIDKVRESLMTHGDARFDNVSNLSPTHYRVQNRMGYKIRADNTIEDESIDDFNTDVEDSPSTKQGYLYLVTKEGLCNIAKGYSSKKIAGVLSDNGYLRESAKRKTTKWNTSKSRRDMQGDWFYTIEPSIFDGDE